MRYTAYFDRFTFDLTAHDANYGSQIGRDATDATDAINNLLNLDYISEQFDSISASDIAAELRSYGAWDEEELKNIDLNRERILWIICGNIREDYIL